MLRTAVNTHLTTHVPGPVTVLSIRGYYKPAIRYGLATALLALVMLLCTSYVKSPAAGDQGMEYHTPLLTNTLKSLLSDDAAKNERVFGGDTTLLFESVRKFYLMHDFKPVWTHAGGVSQRAEHLLELLGRAREYGLEPARYHVPAMHDMLEQIARSGGGSDPAGLKAGLELLMTDAALAFMVNLRTGYTPFDSTLTATDWFAALPGIFHRGVRNDRIAESILLMQPEFLEYRQLQQATARFVQAGPLSDQRNTIAYPAADQEVLDKQLRMALINLGYLTPHARHTGITGALKRFQRHHGLETDGKPGRNTIEALEQSKLDRYKKLALNLDRLRKQTIPGDALLYVNIPAYRLKIFRNNNLVDTFRVIVGHPATPTPQLTGTMETITANPVWYVPSSITRREILPKIKSDSGYLSRNGFKILDAEYRTVDVKSLNLETLTAENFNYTLRQNRGSDNSLGQVKFAFTNPHAIYLHDTPGKALFHKDIRAFSHGCVRVKDPERLAGYIVREINADTTDIARLIRRGRHHEIDVAGSLPIHIRYITCEADRSGNLYFYKDIYNLDKKEMAVFERFMEI